MRYGHFFKLDKDSSFADQQVSFRYLPVKLKEGSNDSNDIHYPVYVVINRFSIDFFYHGKDSSKAENHVNTKILHLPISLNLNVKDYLSDKLIGSYNRSYNIHDDYYHNVEDDKLAYWNLDFFCDDKKTHYKDKKSYIFLRKLILDFIYDLAHSSVFKNSPNYEKVETRLRENYIFAAISIKAEYYYNRELYERENIVKLNKETDAIDIYLDNLDNSETKWINVIDTDKSFELSNDSNGWFKTAEKELCLVLFDKKDIMEQASNFPIVVSIGMLFIGCSVLWMFTKISLWYLFLPIFILIFYFEEKFKSNQNTKQNRCGWRDNMISRAEFKDEMEHKRLDEKLYKKTATWFLRRYSIGNALTIFLQQKPKETRFLSYMFNIFLITIFICDSQYGWLFPKDIQPTCVDKILSYLIIWMISIIIFILLYILIFFWKYSLTFVGLAMPRLLMSISSAWLVSITSADLWKNALDQTFDISLLFPLFGLLLVMIFVCVEIRNLAPDISPSLLSKRAINLLIVGLFYSVLIGFVCISATSKSMLVNSGYLKNFYIEKVHHEKLYKTNNGDIDIWLESVTNKDEKKSESYKHQEELFNWLPFLTTTNKAFLSNHLLIQIRIFNFLPVFLPAMLIYQGIFALFIGIFIQLIFEDKPVTEPL